MIKIFVAIAVTIVVCFGLGIELSKRMNIKRLAYSAPLGFISLISILQLFYYPIQFFNLHFNYIIIISLIVYVSGIALFVKNYREAFNEIINKRTLVVLGVFVIFFIVFFKSFIDLEFSDSPMYLNYISQNINIEKLNMFHLYTGLKGAEWEGIYLFQGYYHFGSFLCWIVNAPHYLMGGSSYVANITISTYGLGGIYSIISTMFLVSMVNYMDIKSKIIKYSVMIFTLLFSNFYYWRVIFSYYGNTFRTLMITMLIFYIYLWFKENQPKYKYILILINICGLACSSSYLFISFSVIFCLMVYLFINKKENAFIDLSIIVSPIVLYTVVMFSRANVALSVIVTLLAVIYYIGVFCKWLVPTVKGVQGFIFKHAKLIFFVLIPVSLVLYSWYLNVFDKTFLYNFDYYFQNHQNYDMVKDYTFRYSTWTDNILNIVRWLGVLIIIFKSKNEEYKWIRCLSIVSIVVFLNPFTTTAVAYLIASNVFYRIVEVLFNPFTEMIFILVIVDLFNNRKTIISILSFVLIASTLAGHAFSWFGNKLGLYEFYLTRGKEVLPLYKISWSEHEIINAYMDEIKGINDSDDQITVISQAEGLRTFAPNTHQLFTARDYFYPYTRINEEFYQIARKHYSWETYPETDYRKSCKYIKEYDVDYIIVKYWENSEFDVNTDPCAETIYESAEFKLKRVEGSK